MEASAEEWGRKGATLSDKTARSQYGLTQEEIYAAIDAGQLQYRPAAMHGNPWLRLLRNPQAHRRTSLMVPNGLGSSRGSIWSHHGQQ